MLALDLFEGMGQAFQVLGRDADTGVGHRDPHPVRVQGVQRHGDLAALRRELHRIGDQVEHHLFQPAIVGVDLGQIMRLQRQDQARVLRLAAHQPDGVLADLGQGHGLVVQGHLARLDLGHVEDVVDQAEQVLAGLQDVGGVALVSGVPQRPEHLAGHDLREAVDGVQRRAQFMGHVGQELRLGLVGGLGPGHGDLVFARQQAEFLLAGLQLVDGDPQTVGGPLALQLLAADGGHVGGGDDRAAVAGEPLGQLQHPAVMQFDLASAGAALGGGAFLLDGEGGDTVQLVLHGALAHRLVGEAEGVLEGLIPQDQPAVFVEQDEGVRDALDAVAQPVLGGLGLGLGAASLGDVQGDAQDDAEPVLAARPARLAARVDPAGSAGRQRYGEGHLEGAEGRGLTQGVFDQIAIARVNSLHYGLGLDRAAGGKAQQLRHEVRHHELAGVQIPFPDAATRRLDGDAETMFGLCPGLGRARLSPALQQGEAQHQDPQAQRRDQQPQVADDGGGPGRVRPPGDDAEAGVAHGGCRGPYRFVRSGRAVDHGLRGGQGRQLEAQSIFQ